MKAAVQSSERSCTTLANNHDRIAWEIEALQCLINKTHDEKKLRLIYLFARDII